MNRQNQLHDFLKSGARPLFSQAFLEKMGGLDTGYCLPGSIMVATLTIPVIAIHVHPADLAYFGFGKKPPEDMNHRFRYLDNPNGDELVQICLHMQQNRQLALNLDPASALTRRYLGDSLKAGLFGFIFFCVSKKLFMTSFTAPDDEETEWIERNTKRAKQLRKNDFEQILMDSRASDTMAGQTGKKYYLAEEGAVAECFFGANSRSVQLDRVNEYLI
jgi:hypothetical protein